MTAVRIISTIALLCYVLLCLLVMRDVRRREIRSFTMFLVAMLIWQVGVTVVSFTSDPTVALWGYRVVIGLGGSFGVFYAQFARDFLVVRSHRWLMRVGYVFAATVAIWTLLGGPGVITAIYQSPVSSLLLPEFGPIAYLSAAVTYLYLIYSAILLGLYHRRSTSTQTRNRIRYLLFGLLLVFFGSMINLSDTLKPYPIDMVANALNATLIAYAILRYHLLDISVVIRKGLLYSLLTATIGIIYFLVVFLALNLFHFVIGYQVFLVSLFLAALTAVAIQPLRDQIQTWLDKRFFREKYDVGVMLKNLSHTAASVLQIDRLTEMILADVILTMHVSSGAFFIIDEKGGQYRLRAHKGAEPGIANLSLFRVDSPICIWLAGHQTGLPSRVLDLDPSFIALWAREREDLKRMQAELLVPLMTRGKLIGILLLGPKLSETPYSSEEQLVLDTLANQTAVAVENARLFSETLVEKERTATIVEQAFAGIILLDSHLKIISLNPAAVTIVGFSAQQVIGMPLGEVLGPSILGERGSLRTAITTGERVAPREATLFIGERRRDVLLGVTPLRDGYLLSLADVTQLKEVDRLKSDIVANVSHEFRTPLAIIKAYTELLMDEEPDEPITVRSEYLSVIDAETDRLTGMVSSLLDLARLEAGQGAVAMTKVDLREVVDEVLDLLQSQAHARQIQVDVDVPGDLPPLYGNRDLLITMTRNLLGNAIKFSRAGGSVTVLARQVDDAVILQVTDHGIGIPEDEMSHLFEKFYRGTAARDAGIRGTGLGLVLVKQAVDAHGGAIAVESKPGQGARFTITLPHGAAAGISPVSDSFETLPLFRSLVQAALDTGTGV
jgi:two-component system, OmpR family, phosphate regulon sensor histidine kinase PhoR